MDERKEKIIKGIQDALLSELEFIRADNRDIQDKLGEIDVLNDTIKFLDNYEEHTKVLNKYISEKKGMER